MEGGRLITVTRKTSAQRGSCSVGFVNGHNQGEIVSTPIASNGPEPDPYTKIAREAASAFIGGNVVGGTGVVGVILILASVVQAGSGSSAVLTLGFLLIGFCGLLYVVQRVVEAALTMQMLRASVLVTGAYIDRMNAGTVNADQVVALAGEYEKRLALLLKSS
jgi:hypothetical protein